ARVGGRGVLHGAPLVAGDARAAADDRGVRSPARAVPPADRVQPHRPAQARVRDVGGGALVLRPLGGPRRPARPRAAAARGRQRPGCRLRRRLHRAAARQLPPGRAARPRARPDLHAGRGSAAVRGDRARPAERAAARAAAVRGGARAGAARRGADARRAHRPRGRALRPRRSGGPRRARGGGVGRLHAAPAAVAASPRARGAPRVSARAAVDEAYAQVERITRGRARNFAFGIMVLPKAKRRAIAAIYAFAREVDDVADGDAPPEEKRARLGELHRRLDAPPSGEAMWVALADARERFPISDQALHDLVDGGLIDLDRQRYESFDELRDYCAHVAGAVGVACIGVYGA